ncbi:MBL fold metallo-hydrolase RNA specificity domain-containing protein [Undibacterium fentianense]|uniref:MBL fold metallo-hydrolase n=1 Tax=Undibacterium fentianense TaxID=2828728 RepID=A0A941E1G4_9BURK|nr:MBL fold metallo-hydrolase [Undibacterium fentianense]MBR7799626.1 MBL fold metallo-hydrolase [Undibacterium fentianense]
MQISFHGANRDVTGSCHLIECAGKKILIDCGLFQGGKELADENREPFGFDPASIDMMLLTHAHLDHCGRLPLLVKYGFKGEIITTAATKDLARLVLLDSAHLQEAEAKLREKQHQRHKSHKSHHEPPLYTLYEVTRCFDFFGRVAHYKKPLSISAGITATFFDAGHILGSASILLELKEAGQSCRIVFSGDLGSQGRKILRDPQIPPSADIAVIETTYGNRLHRSLRASVKEFYQAITETFQQGGNVVIPSFALERTQEILWYLREGIEKGKLPASMQVFLDSPMAISATEIFRQHPECFDEEAYDFLQHHRDPFAFNNLHITRDIVDSMAINRITSGAVIIAGSGMCNGGRIRHHLKHHLWRKNASIVFVGFAAKGTLARQIIDGEPTVRLLGEDIDVNAKVYTINGFSAHADQAELLSWLDQLKPTHTFLVHGEEEVMQDFAKKIRRLKTTLPIIPSRNQSVILTDLLK